jgi:hypothetical protein
LVLEVAFFRPSDPAQPFLFSRLLLALDRAVWIKLLGGSRYFPTVHQDVIGWGLLQALVKIGSDIPNSEHPNKSVKLCDVKNQPVR